LGAQMSNEDEDAVEDELAAIEAEEAAKSGVGLPSTGDLVEPMPQAPKETPKERAARRAREREGEQRQHDSAEPIAA